MDEFLSTSGVAATHDAAVNAALRGNWALVDHLSTALAGSVAQGDADVVYAGVYAAYLAHKAR